MSRPEREAFERLVGVVEDVMHNGYAFVGLAPCVCCGVERPRHDHGCELEAALRESWRVLTDPAAILPPAEAVA